MTKKLLLIFLALVFPVVAFAQGAGYTNVTGTFAGYPNGSVQASFLNQSTASQLSLLNGSVFPTSNVTNFDSSGNFSFWLADDLQIQPQPSQWQITACQHGGAQPLCCVRTVTITGATQSLTPSLANCPGAPGPGPTPGTTTPGDGYVNILSYGVGSGASLATAILTSNTSTPSISSNPDFVINQGVMVNHAGAACGSATGAGCASPPTPTVSVQGFTGSFTYSYQLRCYDGLGGFGLPGVAGATTTGNGLLVANVVGTVITGNYNTVSWTGNAGCPEVAIYRNGAYIAKQYSPPSGPAFFNDLQNSVTMPTDRDIPGTTASVTGNDNYVGFITAISGLNMTFSPRLTFTPIGATMYHSDTPLMQAAVTASHFIIIPVGTFIFNYPINYTQVSALFKQAGAITGSGTVLCDTGEICFDLTGSQNIDLRYFTLASGPVDTSMIAIYISRDTATASSAQNISTHNLIISPGTNTVGSFGPGMGGLGNVGIYNHAAEIQYNYNPQFQVDRWYVATANNINYVSSPFSATDVTTSNSMSSIQFYSANGGGYTMGEFEDAFTVAYHGGYFLGAPGDSRHPWAIEEDTSLTTVAAVNGEVGRLTVDKMRIESKPGLIDVAAGSSLQEPWFDADVYRGNFTLPQVQLENLANMSNGTVTHLDDYGGSTTSAPLVGGPGICTVQNTAMNLGIHETMGNCTLSGQSNQLYGFNTQGDWSLPPTLGFTGSQTGGTWIKLGTWQFAGAAVGTDLGLTIYGGTSINPGSQSQSRADIVVRMGNSVAGTPNITGAELDNWSNPEFDQLKVVDTALSGLQTNKSWDIYVHETASYGGGEYTVSEGKFWQDAWTNIDAVVSDPGVDVNNIYVGTVSNLGFLAPGAVGCLAKSATTGIITGTGINCGSGGGMVYPTGTGLAVVSGGVAWTTTIPLTALNNIPTYGSGVPSGGACTSAYYGLLYTNTATSAIYSCTSTGWVNSSVASSFPATNGIVYNTSTTASANATQAQMVAAIGTTAVTNATLAANLSGTPTVPNGTAATTQTAGDVTTKLASDAFVSGGIATAVNPPGPTGSIPYDGGTGVFAGTGNATLDSSGNAAFAGTLNLSGATPVILLAGNAGLSGQALISNGPGLANSWGTPVSVPNYLTEAPSGLTNGTNKTFLTTHPPSVPTSITVFHNGSVVNPSLYSVSGNTITFGTAPTSGDAIEVAYVYNSTPPTIVNQPATQSVVAGTSVTFSCTAAGASPISYQWQQGGVNIGGATLSTYTISSTTTPMNGNAYACVATNGVGSATSSAATLSVSLGASLNASSTSVLKALPWGVNGVSYEKVNMGYGQIFHAGGDQSLINSFRTIAPTGSVVRFGGNSVENYIWTPGGAGGVSGQVAPGDLSQLNTFLNLTGWKAIYGINIGGDDPLWSNPTTPTLAAQEATAVMSALGSNLVGFEIGNEQNIFARGGNPYIRQGLAGNISKAASNSGGATTYNGTFTVGPTPCSTYPSTAGCAANFWVGKKVAISGFTNAGNNIANGAITASTSTTLTVTNPGTWVLETKTVPFKFITVTATTGNSAGVTTYSGDFVDGPQPCSSYPTTPGCATNYYQGWMVSISGFSNLGNNVSASEGSTPGTVTASTPTTISIMNPGTYVPESPTAAYYLTDRTSVSLFETTWMRYYNAIIAANPTAPIVGMPAGYDSLVSVNCTFGGTGFTNCWGAPWLSYITTNGASLAFMVQHYGAGTESVDTAGLLDFPVQANTGSSVSNYKLSVLAGQLNAAPNNTGTTNTGKWRLAETEDTNGGANPLSSTYATAIWDIDMGFGVVLNGGLGLNDHGGGQNPPNYSPVFTTQSGGPSILPVSAIGPISYGKTLFNMAGTGNITSSTLTTTGLTDVTAYSVDTSAALGGSCPTGTCHSVMIVNKDLSTNISVVVTMPGTVTSATSTLLTQGSAALYSPVTGIPYTRTGTVTQAVSTTGTTNTYTGNFVDGLDGVAANYYVGWTVSILGFLNPGNNITGIVASSDATHMTVTIPPVNPFVAYTPPAFVPGETWPTPAAWSGVTAYTTNQCVTNSGNTWCALQNSTNQNPSSTGSAYWVSTPYAFFTGVSNPSATVGVTLGGAVITTGVNAGTWSATPATNTIPTSGSTFTVPVPPVSAVLIKTT